MDVSTFCTSTAKASDLVLATLKVEIFIWEEILVAFVLVKEIFASAMALITLCCGGWFTTASKPIPWDTLMGRFCPNGVNSTIDSDTSRLSFPFGSRAI